MTDTAAYYEGPVCYVDGWHHAVVTDPTDGDIPGERLVLEDNDDGSLSRYRLATDADTSSWHDRKHRQFASIVMEDGEPGLRVTAEDLAAIKEFLASKGGE